MGHVDPPDRTQTLEGTLERITFQNDETGYTVARLIPRGKTHEVTIIGALAGLNVGEAVRLRGAWVTHPKHGRQFEVSSYQVELPATIEGIRKYLGSGLVKGIGPANATRIVDYFGLRTLEVIESDANRLQEVPGIGPKRAAGVARAWEEQRQIKEIMLFLQSNGVSATLAVKIYKQYGDQAATVVRTSPYRLAKDVYGIGFKTADKIARQMGMAADAPQRLEAGLLYALGKDSDAGHCYGTRPALAEASRLLEVEPAACEAALAAIVDAEEAIEIPPVEAFPEGAIYLAPFPFRRAGRGQQTQPAIGEQARPACPLPDARLGSGLWVAGDSQAHSPDPGAARRRQDGAHRTSEYPHWWSGHRQEHDHGQPHRPVGGQGQDRPACSADRKSGKTPE